MNKRIKRKLTKRYGAKHWHDVGLKKGLFIIEMYCKEHPDEVSTDTFNIPYIVTSKNGKELITAKLFMNAYPASTYSKVHCFPNTVSAAYEAFKIGGGL